MGGLQERGTDARTGRALSSRPGFARSRPALSLSCRPGPGRRSTKRHRPCRSGAPSRAPVGQRVGIAVLVAADVVDLGIEPLGVVIPDQNAHRAALRDDALNDAARSEEHTSELQSLMRTSYAVFCLKKQNNKRNILSVHPPTQRSTEPTPAAKPTYTICP